MNKNKNKVRITIIGVIVAVILGFVLYNAAASSSLLMKNHLVNKYGWDKKDIEVVEYRNSYYDYSLFPLDFHINHHNNRWICDYKGRKFNVELTEHKYADDYQLEDIFKWCTKYLQENVDEDIVGIEMYSDVIYHSSEKIFDYELEWSPGKVFTEEDSRKVLEVINNNFYSPVLFYKKDIELYKNSQSKDTSHYNGNEEYQVFSYEKQMLYSNEFEQVDENDIVIVLTSDLSFCRDSYRVTKSICPSMQITLSLNSGVENVY
ncbi:MAG: hypothetical protein IJT65_01775 [Eubacterium sp.]|nr:hypothetical protein [Eubacterium sp.]